jgi:hypothetical protein
LKGPEAITIPSPFATLSNCLAIQSELSDGCRDAVITARKGETMTSITEQTETAQSAGNATAKSTKKARVGARPANVASKKGKTGKKATPAKKTPKGAKQAKGATPAARDGSKAAKILDLLKRPGGVTSKELQKASGWQPHSVRGFLSGTVGKKMGLTVTSTKSEDGERTYSVKA